MEQKRDMSKHVTFVAALHIGFGILKLIGAVMVFFFINLAQSYVDEEIANSVLVIIKVLASTLVGASAVLGIIGGIGLLGYKGWARILIIVLSALNCLNVPIGTAKGVYSIWALLQDDTVMLFENKAQDSL